MAWGNAEVSDDESAIWPDRLRREERYAEPIVKSESRWRHDRCTVIAYQRKEIDRGLETVGGPKTFIATGCKEVTVAGPRRSRTIAGITADIGHESEGDASEGLSARVPSACVSVAN